MWIWWFGTFNSRNALSVQFSRIRTSTSFVIFHSCSATLPLTSLMLFLIWIRKKVRWKKTIKKDDRGLQRINGKRKDDVSLFRVKQIVHLFLFFSLIPIDKIESFGNWISKIFEQFYVLIFINIMFIIFIKIKRFREKKNDR